MEVKISGFIYAKGTRYFDPKTAKYVDGPEFVFNAYDNLAGGEHFRDWVLIGPHEITAHVPDDFDPRLQLAKNLEEEKKRLSAEFNKRVTEIDRQIQTYLAIESR